MTTRKRNEYLDIGFSDEEDDLAQNSDELEDTKNSRLKGISSRGSKRRKVDTDDDDGSKVSEEEGEEDEELQDDSSGDLIPTTSTPAANSSPKSASTSKSKPPTLKPLTPVQLAKSQRLAQKTGVLYISRIPPFMKPSTLRHLLSPYGAISRLFLTPEPPTIYSKRIRSGGNKKRSFIDGWVEFVSKKHAKICAETLNGECIGGRKRGWYHDDIWNVKYLRGFKWGDLMAQVQDEERVREGRVRAEREREGRERKMFLGGVEAAKRERGREETRRRREERRGRVEDGEEGTRGGGQDGKVDVGGSVQEGMVREAGKKGFERRFRQNEVKGRGPGEQGLENHSEDVRRVLSKIF
ncbi:RNA-binding ATPase activator esf2 [Trapelia coarctata]|nr:RNA-binding ATPase activator esf2 [Trapelia coarctata]